MSLKCLAHRHGNPSQTPVSTLKNKKLCVVAHYSCNCSARGVGTEPSGSPELTASSVASRSVLGSVSDPVSKKREKGDGLQALVHAGICTCKHAYLYTCKQAHMGVSIKPSCLY